MTDRKDHWSDRKVLVTGAAGFLGGWVVQALASAGARVVGLDLNWAAAASASAGCEAVTGDVRDAQTLAGLIAGAGVEVTIHLAAQTLVAPALEDPVDTFEHNVQGTWTVLEACRRAPRVASVVIASSDKAYGDAGGAPYDEQMALRPGHPYDASKACGELVACAYARSYSQPVAITRCGNLYGGGDFNWSRIVPGTIRSALKNERPVIRSDGACVRDYLYVEDAVRGLLALAEALEKRPGLAGQAFNFAGGERPSVLQICWDILRLMGSELAPDIQNSAVGEIPQQRVCADKAGRVLGWTPVCSLDEGLQKTVVWYSQYLSS